MPLVAALLIFGLVALAVFLAGSFIDRRNAQARLLRERLASVQKTSERQPSEELALLRDEMLSKIPALDNLLRRSERLANFPGFLDQADVKIHVGSLLMLGVASAIAFGGIGFLLASSLPPNQGLLFALVGIVVGAIVPYSYVARKRRKRFQKFEELFPDALDTLTRAVRAGHAFTTSLELIAGEIADPISSEFRKLYEEQKFGLPVRDALINLSVRMPLVDVKFFITAVMLQRETGGNLAEILENLSYVIRERFKIMRQVRVYTAQGRLTMALLMGMPPIIVVVMLSTNPGFIRPLFADPIGHALIVVGIALQTVGYFVIRKIIQIQV